MPTPILAQALPSMTTQIMDNLYPALSVIVPIFGLKLAVELAPKIFKRTIEGSMYSQLSPIMAYVPDEDKVDPDYEYYNPDMDDYVLECEICGADMTDEVLLEYDDGKEDHICNDCMERIEQNQLYVSANFQEYIDSGLDPDDTEFCPYCDVFMGDYSDEEIEFHMHGGCMYQYKHNIGFNE